MTNNRKIVILKHHEKSFNIYRQLIRNITKSDPKYHEKWSEISRKVIRYITKSAQKHHENWFSQLKYKSEVSMIVELQKCGIKTQNFGTQTVKLLNVNGFRTREIGDVILSRKTITLRKLNNEISTTSKIVYPWYWLNKLNQISTI
jgi:hypothetical protein